ncbi:MAG: hypothetical protein OEW42_16845 [Acidimicrobiia bacterium]|nr:hypothetical protein [Acidimicrobiia bacterium]MDH5237780.1 hypothetical protein [Acidimicrobiia bacterium]
MADRRVSLVPDAGHYVGPALALLLASRDHDLVVGDPVDGLVDELVGFGVDVEVVAGVTEDRPGYDRLVEAARSRFGRVDSASMASGRVITGVFVPFAGGW